MNIKTHGKPFGLSEPTFETDFVEVRNYSRVLISPLIPFLARFHEKLGIF
jgi:hypothetical protein